MDVIISIIAIAVVLIVGPIMLTRRKQPKPKPTSQQQETDMQVLADAKRLMLLMEVKRQAEERGDQATVQAALSMTYNGEMPIEKADGTYTSIYNEVCAYNIAGLYYRDNIHRYIGQFMGYIQPEPTNRYDPNAIAIYHSDGHHLGYISATRTSEVRGLCPSFPYPCFGVIDDVSSGMIAIETPKESPHNS